MRQNIKKTLLICTVVIIAACAAIYYYGLHLSFWPDPEFSNFPMRYYLEERFNYKFGRYGFGFSEMLAYLSYTWFGIGFKGIRIYATLMYFFIILCVAIASMHVAIKKSFKWYAIPMFAFIAVLLNPGSSVTCGHHTSAYHLYPYDMHTEAVFLVFFLLALLQYMLLSEPIRKRWILVIIIGALSIVGIIKTDLLFIVGFILPVLCVIMTGLVKKNRDTLKIFLLGVFGLIVILRCLSMVFKPFKSFFVVENTPVYGSWVDGGHVYGDVGIVNLQEIWTNMSNLVTELLALFNVDLSGSIISIHMIVNVLRIFIVFTILILAIRQIRESFHSKDRVIDYVSLISAYGIVFNIFIIVITNYGRNLNCIRYMTMIVFFGTILLCRRIDEVCSFMFGAQKNNKLFICVFFSICCLADFRPFWRADSFQMDYEHSLQEVANIIRKNQLGTGIGGHWYSSTLTALMEGECAVIEWDLYYEELIKETQAYYIVEGTGEGLEAAEYFKSFDLEHMFGVYGEPDKIWETDAFTLYYYEDGLQY